MYDYIKHLGERSVGHTDTNRVKKTMEWFFSTVFQEESIRNPEPDRSLPAPLRMARSLETGPNSWQSRESIFIKQAKVLVNYEDDFPYDQPVQHYFPTYQSLTDPELRGYFSWRTKLRRGEVQKTSLTFVFLYLYELINQIGVADPMDGYRKMAALEAVYGPIDSRVLPYLKKWRADYVIYYDLDPNLLADNPRVVFDRCVTILDNVQNQAPEKILYAVKHLAPKWLERSKFYGEHPADCDAVIVRVLRRVWAHYAARCKKGMVEQYFGSPKEYPIRLFDSAVFYDRGKGRSREYAVDERCVYRCKNGLWTVERCPGPPEPNAKLDALMKTIDAVMRQEYHYRYPVKCETDTKWLLKLIREEIQGFLAEKEAAEAKKITIDYSQLAKIRRDAALTRDKLIVEEEAPEPPAVPAEEPEPRKDAGAETPLSPPEYRLLQNLLYGGDYGWVPASGLILSVLVDSINEKLFDQFSDSVLTLEDKPELIEDYIPDLKEMVRP